MKKVFIVSMIMSLSIITSISLAQQATTPTPTSTTPSAPSPASSAPAAPAPKNAIQETGFKNIALSGGVASNVKVNMMIRNLHECENCIIFPHMGEYKTIFTLR